MGKSADELKLIKDASFEAYEQARSILIRPKKHGRARLQSHHLVLPQALNDAQWKPLVMRVRAKMETWQEQSRVKMHVLQLDPVSFVSEGKLLLADIAKYNLPDVVVPDVVAA